MKLQIPETMCPPSARAALLSAYDTERIPHALILEGAAEQTLMMAKWLAQAAVCTSPEKRPCGNCSGCIKAKAGSHPDITLAGGGETSRSFHKEEIEELRRNVYVRPNEAACRVFVLENAQNLSQQAQNALLKVLEEPPASVQFLLTCNRSSSLLPTVRSRAQIYRLDTTQLPQDDGLASQIAQALCNPKESALLYLTAPLTKDRVRLRTELDKLILIFRDALMFRYGGTPISGEEDAVRMLVQTLTRTQLYQITQTVRKMRSYVERNVNMTLLVTDLCAKLRSEAGR
ncbi:MAG: ATP-binding protein [Oscillospiraceae bacterium]|nr:ATP-binding protein [Oscillospiraceae bacterium]